MKFDFGSRFAMTGAEAAPLQNMIATSSDRGSMLELFGLPADSGPVVTDTTAMQVGAVYACLAKLGGVVLQLPLHEYDLDERGDRERVTPASTLWWLLNESPSPAWTAASWKEWIVRCVKLTGDQHTEIIRNRRGEPIELRPHHPYCVRVRTVEKRLRYDVWDAETGKGYGVDQDDMLHFTGFGFDGECSVSAIKWGARNAISNSLASAEYMGKSLAGSGMPNMVMKYPRSVNAAQKQDLLDSFERAYPANSRKRKLPLILSEGAEALGLSITAVDMEVMAARRMDKGEICEVLEVPPVILGDSEKASSWGTGIEQIKLGWVTFAVQPMLCRWEEELNRKLFRRAGRFVEFSLTALLRGDSKAQADAYRAALGGPGLGDAWMTVNQVRRLQNLPKDLDPLADALYRAQRDQPKT